MFRFVVLSGTACIYSCASSAVLIAERERLGNGASVGFEFFTTLAAYTRNAYIFARVFVELNSFVAFRNQFWTDEDLRALQNFLLLSPDSRDLIRGGSGLRKIRWSAQGRGKRGGARVIYYWHVPKHRIYLIYGYVKSEREDLTPQQITVLAELMKDVKDG